MANNEFTIPIPARLKNVAKGGHVAGADQIIDDALGKEQSVINQEVSEAIEGNTEAVAAERQRAEAAEDALDTRLSDVEELAEISIDGGEAKIATGEDFHNPTAEQRAKVTTVGAILDGADDEPTAGSENLVKSGGVANIAAYIKGLNSTIYSEAGVRYENFVPVDIPANTKIEVLVTGNSGLIDQNLFGNIVLIDKNNTLHYLSEITIGEKQNFLVDYDVKKVGISRGATGVIGSGPITLNVKLQEEDISQLRSYVSELQGNVTQIQSDLSNTEKDIDNIQGTLDGSNEEIELFNNPDVSYYFTDDLTKGHSDAFECQKIDIEGYNSITLYAKTRGVGVTSITDSSDNILQQINVNNQPESGISNIDLTLLNNPKWLYFTNCVELVSSPYVKGYKTGTSYLVFKEETQEDIETLQEDVNNVKEVLNTIVADLSSQFASKIHGNNFNNEDALTLPSEFSDFNIPIQISKTGDSFGWSTDIKKMQKNNSNGGTYFLSPNGSDTNDGLTIDAPLKTLSTAIGKSDVNTIVFLSGTYTCGIHFTSGQVINKEINLIGIGRVTMKCSTSQNPIDIQAGIYIENIIFDGGVAALTTHLTTQTCVFYRCKFLNASSIYTGNGLYALGGNYYLEECEASNNMRDGFNYHRNTVENTNYNPHSVEINCCGYFNGIADSNYINNGSTTHDNGRAIRIFCEYGYCKGGVVADADGAKSLNIGVTSCSSQCIDGPNNRKSNFGAQNNGVIMYLIGCSSFGSLYDCFADNNCTIYRDTQFPKEGTDGTGSIQNYVVQ